MQKLLVVIFFWVYGLRGAVFTDSVVGDSLITIILSITFYFLSRSDLKIDIRTCIDSASLAKFGLIIAVLILIVNTKLFYPLSFDQFYYAQQSLLHSIFVIDAVTSLVDIQNLSLLSYKGVVQIFSLCMLGGLFTVARYSIKAPFLITLIFIATRTITLVLGGIQNTHPPLQLLPLLTSSAILGVHEFSFRITQVIPLALIFWIATRLLSNNSGLRGFLSSLSLCTFPLLLHSGTLVESSIYTAMSVIVVLTVLYYKDRFTPHELLFLTFLVGMAPLIRIPAFLGIIVLYGFYVLYDRNFLATFAKQHLFISLTWIPYVVYSVLRGTPATNEDPLLTPSLSLIQRLDVVSNGLPEWYFFLLLVPLMLAYKHTKGTTLLWSAYFLAGCLIFTGIRESLLYIDRYKVEYILPFVLFGSIMGISHVLESNRKVVLISFTGLVLLLTVLNITQFWRYTTNVDQRLTINALGTSSPSILTEVNYPYKDQLQSVGNRENLLVAGVTYGVLPQILSGWSIAEVLSTKTTYKEAEREINWAQFDLNRMTEKTRVDRVLTTNLMSNQLRNDLEFFGFEVIDSTVFRPHGTTSYLYSQKKQ